MNFAQTFCLPKLAAFCCLAALSAHSNAASSAAAAAVCPLPYKPVMQTSQALETAGQIIAAYRLSSLNRDCLQLQVEEPKGGKTYYSVDVRENHNARCGGDPDVSPRVFTLNIGHDGRFTTDAASLDGSFAVPPCPLSGATK